MILSAKGGGDSRQGRINSLPAPIPVLLPTMRTAVEVPSLMDRHNHGYRWGETVVLSNAVCPRR